MTTSDLDTKYLTVGELFNAVGRLIETQGHNLRTNVTGIKVSESTAANTGGSRAAFASVGDLRNDIRELHRELYR
jgi:hypothetical protein